MSARTFDTSLVRPIAAQSERTRIGSTLFRREARRLLWPPQELMERMDLPAELFCNPPEQHTKEAMRPPSAMFSSAPAYLVKRL